jgi:hypothetical protein
MDAAVRSLHLLTESEHSAARLAQFRNRLLKLILRRLQFPELP